MANEELQTLLRTGIQAAQSGNKAIAREIFTQVTEQDPRNELAWIWLASVADSADERRACLERVLEINPNNERARQALDKLAQVQSPPSTRRPTTEAAPSADLASQAGRQARLAQLEREMLLAAQARAGHPRRVSPITFMILGLLAVAMIALGLLLLVGTLREDQNNTTPIAQAPTPTALLTATFPSGPTPMPGFVTATPIGGVLRTVPPQSTLPPTWTPSPTPTVTVTPTPPPTLPPLDSYQLLASAQREGNEGWRLVMLAADGSEEDSVDIRLPGGEGENAPTVLEVYDAAYSPDGSQIVFTVRLSESRVEGDESVTVEYEDLFIAGSDGGTAERLTTLEADRTGDAAWSPDGTQIAFSSDAEGDADIYLINADGSNVHPITFNEAQDREPTWSPDGNYLAYASDQSSPGFYEIWRMTPDGANQVQLTDSVNNSYAPAWSPDGQWIAFVSDREMDTDLYIMNAQGLGTLQQSLMPPGAVSEERDPAWSPDSRWIAFSSNWNSPTFEFEIFVIRPDGSEMKPVTGGDGPTRYPVWRPR